jgi:2,5-furandicarboxylate decarboxylase 1
MQLAGKNKLRVRMMPPISHLGIYQKRAEEKGKPLEAAVCIGNHPQVMFAAATKVPVEDDELEFAGAIGQRPVKVTSCKTVDVDVPADTEIVIEGKILPNVREEEGPFGEFTDSYVTVMKNHVFEVTAITHREQPLYQEIFAGGREDQNLIALPIETQVYKAVRTYVPTVRDVAMTPGNNGFTFHCTVSIKKESEDQPKMAILSALAAHPWIKMCSIVDEDVELHDPSDVVWAVSTRCRPDKGVYIIPAIPSYTREDQRIVHQGRVGIDATVPLDCKKPFERRKVPGEESIQLDDYLAK